MVEFIPVDHDPFRTYISPPENTYDTAVSANDPTAFHPPQQTTPEGYPYVQSGTEPSFPEVGPTAATGQQQNITGNITRNTEPPLTVSTRRSPYDPYIDTHANRVGIDPNWMRRIMAIESGGDPYNRTGSYQGLFQLSSDEFRRNGGQGNIYGPEQNTAAAANRLAREASEFRALYGREPSLTDLYMVHQQGAGGYDAHMSYPDAPAWENMYSTAEGRQKGSHWAKQAIWGNLPDAAKRYYGSVENVSSRDFVNTWRGRVEGGSSPQLVPVDYDPWEASSARTRARYPTREPDPASLAASSGGVGWGTLLADRYQQAVTTPQRAFEAAGELQRTGDQYDPRPGLSAG